MDRMVQTALNSLKMMMENQAATAHNLANVSTPGFKQDVAIDFSSIYLNKGSGIEPRIVSTRNTGGFSVEQGQMENTSNPLDVAINNEGYFIIQPKEGELAYSRRGDLQIGENGILLDGAGNTMLNEGLAPIELPPFKSITVSPEGQIYIKPIGGDENAPPLLIDLLANSIPEEEIQLKKSLDGHIRGFRINEDGQEENAEIVPNQQARMISGFLEKSNVNVVEEMVKTLDQQRKFEMHIKFIQMADEVDRAGASLMRMPGM